MPARGGQLAGERGRVLDKVQNQHNTVPGRTFLLKIDTTTEFIIATISTEQLQLLYDRYLEILKMEVEVLGVSPTEARHLIGRVGEFHCALQVGGTLAHTPNQHGFDVICPRGRRISVKTTAQANGFVAIGKTTASQADDIMVVQYQNGGLSTVFFGPMAAAVEVARHYKPTNNFEFDLARARRLAIALASEPATLSPQSAKEEFEAALQPFAQTHGLTPAWRSDLLLQLAPLPGSSSATLCVSFEPGYWEMYMRCDDFIREQARANVAGQTVAYHRNWGGLAAQEVHGLKVALAPLR